MMTGHLFAASHYAKFCWLIGITIGNKFPGNLYENAQISVQENWFENTDCKMSAIMTRPQCVNKVKHWAGFPLAIDSFTVSLHSVNTSKPRQNGRHLADDTFKRIFVNENVRILNEISLKFVPKGLINNIPSLVQIMAWRPTGDKPLSEPMMVCLPTHICVTRPQLVKTGICLHIVTNYRKDKYECNQQIVW